MLNEPRFCFRGQEVAEVLTRRVTERGAPTSITVDHDMEFTSKALEAGAWQRRVKLDFIPPGESMENGHIESFNGRFQDTCLNQLWFRDLDDARRVIDAWRHHYNHVRPHSLLGYVPPAMFTQKATLYDVIPQSEWIECRGKIILSLHGFKK